MNRTAITAHSPGSKFSFRIEAQSAVRATPRSLIWSNPDRRMDRDFAFPGGLRGTGGGRAAAHWRLRNCRGRRRGAALGDARFAGAADKDVAGTLFIVLLCFICVPNYYASPSSGLPWISIRRLFLFVMIVPFALALSGSSSLRGILQRKLVHSRSISACLSRIYSLVGGYYFYWC